MRQVVLTAESPFVPLEGQVQAANLAIKWAKETVMFLGHWRVLRDDLGSLELCPLIPDPQN